MAAVIHDLSILNDPQGRSELSTSLNIPYVEYCDVIDSTQNRVRELAESGAPEWAVVVADHQTEGRGQHGRTWFSTPGSALLFSLLIRPASVEAMSLLPIRTALAIVRALHHLHPVREVTVKWPNDLIIVDSKVGGILCEGIIRGEQHYAVVGVGINIQKFNAPLDNTQMQPAWLRDDLRTNISRLDMLKIILQELRTTLPTDDATLTNRELSQYSQYDWLYGSELLEPVEGTAVGINGHGHLLVKTSGGDIRTVISGSVRLKQSSN
jgi:BirA family transcriptional regulator, biotin operon repressor / biotin---[acetyl-CoA-carboxylase] ligase